MASPQKAVTNGLWEVISLPFCLLRQAWIWTWFLTSPMSGDPLPLLVPGPYWVPLCIQGSPQIAGRRNPPLAQAVYWHLVGSPSSRLGGLTLVTRGVITHRVSAIPYEPPRNVVGSC
jgi:hypothetical protein